MINDKKIRKIFHNDEWWYSAVDLIAVLSESKRPRKYWSDLKNKLVKQGFSDLNSNVQQFKLLASDNKYYATDCINGNLATSVINAIPTKE